MPSSVAGRPCPKCGVRPRPTKNTAYCTPCGAEYAKAKRAAKAANGESTHSPKQLREQYGCTPEEYKERMATSPKCQKCGSTHRLQYDHDHDTMAFRGVLCWDCNVGIGKLGDSIEGLEAALAYLRRHYETT